MRLELSEVRSRQIILWFGAATALFHIALIALLPTWFGYFFPQQSLRAISLVLAAALILMTTSWRGDGHASGRSGGRVTITPIDVVIWLVSVLSDHVAKRGWR